MTRIALVSAAILALALPAALAAPEPAVAQQARPAPKARFNLDSRIKDMVAHPGAKAVLERHLKGVTSGIGYLMYRDKTLRQMSTDPHVGSLTPAKLAQIERELAEVK